MDGLVKRSRVVLLLMALLVTACSSSYRPLAGTVKLDGQPLNDVTVYFAIEGEELPIGMARTGRDGSFFMTRLSSSEPVPPGEYKVIVVQMGQGEGDSHTDRLIPEIYGDAATTPLSVKVPLRHELVLELDSR